MRTRYALRAALLLCLVVPRTEAQQADTDVLELERVRFVMKGGVVVKQ